MENERGEKVKVESDGGKWVEQEKVDVESDWGRVLVKHESGWRIRVAW